MGRKFVEANVRRDGQGQFAEKAGGGWLDRVSHQIDQRLGGAGGKGADRNFGAPASRAKARSANAPLTDAEFEARTRMVTDVIGKAMKTMATDKTQVTESGRWKPERDQMHRRIADELYAHAANVPTTAGPSSPVVSAAPGKPPSSRNTPVSTRAITSR